MKKSLLFLTSWFLLASTAHVDAAPVVGLITSVVGAIGSLGTIGQLILGVALKVGVSLIERARQKKNQAQQTPSGVKGSLRTGGDNSLAFIIGTYATAGSLNYVNTWGSAGNTPNAYLTQVIELADLPVSGMSNIIWISGALCTIDWNAAPTSQGYPVLEYRRNGVDYLWIKFHDGSQVVADPFLTATFAAGDRPWQSDMIGYGVPIAIVTARFNREVFTSPPACKFVLQGIKLYDPRKDSTVGGNGAHRWSTPSTWEFSDNPKVAQYNIIRGLSFNGQWFYGGQNVGSFQLPLSNWFAAMNECDRLVAKAGGGTEKQFRCGAEIETSTQPLDIVKELDKSCNGRTAEMGGIYKTLCGAPGLPVYSFSDEDIVITEQQEQDPYPGLEDTINGANGAYPEPAEAWTTKDAPPRYNADLEAADANNRLLVDIEYPMVPYGLQVQRLMDAALKEARRFRKHTATMPPEGWLIEPLDTVAWTSSRNGYETKRFLMGSMDDLANVNQAVAIQEIDPADYDWSSDYELPTSSGPTGPIVPPPQPMYGWQVQPAVFKDGAGQDFRPTIRISAAPDQDDVQYVWVQVRLAADGSTVFDSAGTPYASPFNWLLNGTFKGNTDYEARGKFVPFTSRETQWSDWLAVTTPNVATDDLIADLQHVGQDVRDRFKELQQGLDDVRPLLEQIIVNYQIGAATSATANRKVEVKVDNNRATFEEQIATVVDELNAVAEAVQQVEAVIDDRLAQGRVRFLASVDPNGAEAEISMMVRVGTEGNFINAGQYIRATQVGGVLSSEIAFDAQRVVFVDSNNPDNTSPAILFQNGQAYLAVANIGHVRAGLIDSPTGKMVINVDAGTFEVFS